jgi:two-component system, NtrC family, nitrogen regulation sensor histidine kinase GlnL
VVALNAGAESLLGISGRVALGQRLDAVLPGIRTLAALVQRAAETGQSYGQEFAFAPLNRADQPIEVACRVTPLRRDPPRVVIELFDTTQWRHIDREHHLMTQREASRRMIRQLAHEVRNPLGGLRGAAQLLERQLPTPELREYTRIIIGEADRLTALTETLLGPARRPAFREVNVHELLERVVTLVASEPRGATEILRDYDPSLPTLRADPDQLLQAFLNLARNAVQAVDGDGYVLFRTRALTNFPIGSRRHRLVASIEVEDDGPGVPPEIADSIFFPLVTGRPDGTGLGLPLSQDLVARHGGLIEFQSRPGRTAFLIRLPLTGEDPRPLEPAA